jgi:hypothetical protein
VWFQVGIELSGKPTHNWLFATHRRAAFVRQAFYPACVVTSITVRCHPGIRS